MPKIGRAGKAQIRDHKIKQLGALHPNSRKASQKHLELLHDDKKALKILTKDLKWKPQLHLFSWFQKAAWMDDQKTYTKDEVLKLAAEYVMRNDEELVEAIRAACIGGGRGRLAPTSKAWEKLKVREHQWTQFEAGELDVPDLSFPKVVRHIKDWKTGNVDQMLQIRTGKYGEKGMVDQLFEADK